MPDVRLKTGFYLIHSNGLIEVPGFALLEEALEARERSLDKQKIAILDVVDQWTSTFD